MDGTEMGFPKKKNKSFAFARNFLVILLTEALLLSVSPFIMFNAETEPGWQEPSLYHTYDELVLEIQEIAENHSSIVSVHNLTTTFEERTVWALKISDEPDINDSAEPDVLFVGGQKANSFISVELALFMLNYLTDNYGQDQKVTDLVNEREVWIIPMLNPDGHAYIGNDTQDWVKNTIDNEDTTFGVNLDRNYGFNWGIDNHTSDQPGDPNYHGKAPFSEAETRAVRSLVENQSFVFSLSFSSPGSIITYPWGYTDSPSPDSELLSEIASDMAMYSRYAVEQSGMINTTQGNMNDWLNANASVLPFTIYAGDEDIPEEHNIEILAQENLPSCLYLLDIADDPNRALRAEWTFIIYMSADDSLLEGPGILDINEMERVGSNPYINIVVQCDRAVGYNSSNGDWTDTRRFLVMKDDDPDIINSPVVENLGEANMGNAQTFLDFVDWSISNYPAEHYFLDLWGHGKGWLGVSKDQSDWLEMDEIKSVLPQFSERIDILGFDNCNMAMVEVYAQFMGYVDYVIGSEKEEDAWGWPYDIIFQNLTSNPQISPLNLSKVFPGFYVEWARNNSWYSATLSTVDMSYFYDFLNLTDAFARELNKTLALYLDNITAAVTGSERYARKPLPRDMYNFSELIVQMVPNTPVKIAAENVMEGIETLVIAEEHRSSPTDGVSVDNAHGIAVWLYDGSTADFATYQTLDFAELTYWDEFLEAYKNPPPKPHVSFPISFEITDSDGDNNNETIDISYSTNVSALNVNLHVYNNQNEHIETFYLNNTMADEDYSDSFNPYDYDLPPDFYNFYIYLMNDANEPQNYTEVTRVWLGNEKPDAQLLNLTFQRSDGMVVGGVTGKNPIDGEDTLITAYVKNVGTTNLSQVKIEILEGENSILTEFIDLDTGEEKMVSTMWFARAGERTIRAVVDGDNIYKEFNESNNEIKEILNVKPNLPVTPLNIRVKAFNRNNINIIGARVQIRNLRTNETINKTTTEKGYTFELEPSWYMEGDLIDVKARYSSVSNNVTIFAYSEDVKIYVNITLDTEIYDPLYYFKLVLIGFEIIGFILVIKYYIGMKRYRGKKDDL